MTREEKAAAFRADPTDPRHGTASAYVHMSCRCDRCRAANREYSRERYRRKHPDAKPRDTTTPEHGTVRMYNRKCYCADCRRAWADYVRERRRKMNRPLKVRVAVALIERAIEEVPEPLASELRAVLK